MMSTRSAQDVLLPVRSTTARRPGRRRLAMTPVGLALLASAWFTVTANIAFWRASAHAGAFAGSSGAVTAVTMAVAVFALHGAFLVLVVNRWTAKPILASLVFVSAAAAYFSGAYGVYLDPDIVRAVLLTDRRESIEYLTVGFAVAMLVQLAAPAWLLWNVQVMRLPWRQSAARRGAVLAALILSAGGALLVGFQDMSALMRNHKNLRYLIVPGNVLVSSWRVVTEGGRDAAGPRKAVATDARMQGHVRPSKPHLLVIVVGETVRAQNWGLNGYARQTTPQLATLPVVNFADVTACGSNTEVSVPCMFSAYGRQNYDQQQIRRSESLLHVLERAGVRTLWRDNQTGCKGVCEGLAFESYREVQESDDFCDRRACRDAIMLRGLHDAIASNPGDVVVVLHQLGNHGPSYYRRYPEGFKVFQPECLSPDLGSCSQAQIVNAYDNAVLETDDFLARTIAMLGADQSHDTAMIYVSDHGESLGENNLFLHGLPYAIAPDTQVKVPMAMWFSPGMIASRRLDVRCLTQRAAQPASHDNLFHSVLGLMEIGTATYRPELDVFAGCQPATLADASNSAPPTLPATPTP